MLLLTFWFYLSVQYRFMSRKIKFHCAGDLEVLVALFQGRLFEEIAEGLKRAKVVIVCASNEVCIILFSNLHYVL